MALESRVEFDNNYLNKSPFQIKAYWSKQLFTGEGKPPEEAPGDLDVLQKIAGSAELIGYVDSSAVNHTVKILTVK